MAVKLTIHDRELLRATEKAQERYLRAAALTLHMIAQEAAGVPNTGKTVRAPIKRDAKGRHLKGSGKQRTVYENSSKPNEPPRVRTGFGRKNIVQGFSKQLMASRVGYTRAARYMTFHELGIRYTKAGYQQRPTIIPSLRDHREKIRRVAFNSLRGVS
jgi:hypothetical protein